MDGDGALSRRRRLPRRARQRGQDRAAALQTRPGAPRGWPIASPRSASRGRFTPASSPRAKPVARRWRARRCRRRVGAACYHLGPERDGGLFDGLAVEAAHRSGAPNFVLATGLLDDDDTVAAHRSATLDAARARGLPMLCANPDRAVVRRDGRPRPVRRRARRRLRRPRRRRPLFRQALAGGLRNLPRTPGRRGESPGLRGRRQPRNRHRRRPAPPTSPAVLVQGGVLAAELGIAWGESAAPDAHRRPVPAPRRRPRHGDPRAVVVSAA